MKTNTGRVQSNVKGGKYNVKNFTFPSDLFGSNAEHYTRCWTMFNINVQKNHKGTRASETIELDDTERAKRSYAQTFARDRDIGTTFTTGAVASGIAGAASWNKIRDGDILGGAAAAVKGTVAGAVITSAVSLSGTTTRETKRIKTAIQLPMPNEFVVSDSQQWDVDSSAMLDMALRIGKEAWDSAKSLLTSDKETDWKKQGAMVHEAAASASLATASIVGSGTISSMTGLAANPKNEMIYKGPGFRGFNLVYQLFPKNEDESEIIKNIIKEFRYHMYPEYFSEEKFTFIYPSEFDITFFAESGKENEFVTRISTCVLTDVSVQYTPNGLWSAHDKGAPSVINLQLSFKEIGIHTKDSIEAGF